MQSDGYRFKGLSLWAHEWLSRVRQQASVIKYGERSTELVPFGYVTEEVALTGFGVVPMRRFRVGVRWFYEVLQEISGPDGHAPLVFTALKWNHDAGVDPVTMWTYDEIFRAHANYRQDLALQIAERAAGRHVFG